MFSTETARRCLPNSLLIVTLASNFGTFMLYMLTCVIAIVAFREHHSFSGIKHMVIPVFGVVANLLCMLFYLVGPFCVAGMSKSRSRSSPWEWPPSGASMDCGTSPAQQGQGPSGAGFQTSYGRIAG